MKIRAIVNNNNLIDFISVDEIIGDKIKTYELKLQNKNVSIVNLYIEGDGVDFCIVEKNKEK